MAWFTFKRKITLFWRGEWEVRSRNGNKEASHEAVFAVEVSDGGLNRHSDSKRKRSN